MPSMGYLQITGESQGRIEGAASYEGEDGLIEVVSFDHAVELQRELSGQRMAGARPVHREIELCKYVDRASPKLMQALLQGELLSEVRFEWYEQIGSGSPELFYSIQLKQALLTRVQPWMPEVLDQARDRYRFMEKVSLMYQTIIWSWGRGDVQYESSWQDGKGRA